MGGRCAEHAEPPSPPFSPQSPPADLSLRQPWKAHGTRSSNLTVPSAESRKRLRFDCSAARYFGTRGDNPARINQRTGFAERPGGSRFAAARPFFGPDLRLSRRRIDLSACRRRRQTRSKHSWLPCPRSDSQEHHGRIRQSQPRHSSPPRTGPHCHPRDILAPLEKKGTRTRD